MKLLLTLMLLCVVALPAKKFGAEYEKTGTCPITDNKIIHEGKGDIGDSQLKKLLSRLIESDNQDQKEIKYGVQEI